MMTQPALNSSPEAGQGRRNARSGLVGFGVFIILVMVIATFAGAYLNATKFAEDQERLLNQRLSLFAEGRAYSAKTWLNSSQETSARLLNSDTFRLFAAEVDQYKGDISMLFTLRRGDGNGDEESVGGQISSQLPYMRNLLDDFVKANGYTAGRIMNSKSQIYISTDPLDPSNISELEKLSEQVVSSGEIIVGQIRNAKGGAMVDFLMPMFAAQYNSSTPTPVAVLVLTRYIGSKLSEWLSSENKEINASLVQHSARGFSYLTEKSSIGELQSFILDEQGNYPFSLRTNLSGTKKVYSLGQLVGGQDPDMPKWWIVVECDESIIAARINDNRSTAYGIASLASLVLVFMGGMGWWWLVGNEQRKVAGQFKALYDVIDNQKRLLDGINATISDPISFSDNNGIYRYVNPAFAKAVGREASSIMGLDTSAVFGFDTAKRLNLADQQARMTGETVTTQEVLWLQSKRHYFQISKSPLRDEHGKNTLGTVAVFRDITLIIEAQEHSRRMVQQTIDALVRAIEESDPFLGGHSRLMGSVASMISRGMNLSDYDTATIEAAANLSQIGKMFVPRDILTKAGALTPDEKSKMEQHVEYAKEVLKDIEFDLPVLEAIYQMSERLDGKGYPRGLQGEQVNIHARILAVANAFTAMARPRSYRPALPAKEVLAILERQKESYDPAVVSMLSEVLKTPSGEKLVQMAATSKAH